MKLKQQWRYLNFTRNNFYVLFPAKGIVSYKQIISSSLCVRLNSGLQRFLYNHPPTGTLLEIRPPSYYFTWSENIIFF